MLLELEVLASTDIKRKKPWSKFAWLGEEKESLFLLDKHRISVLYLPSGKTTRKIPKLSPLLQDVLAFTTTANGHFLLYLLRNGDIAVWHKDTDILRLITRLNSEVSSEQLSQGAVNLCLSDDCSSLVLVLNNNHFYVWQKDPRQNIFTTREGELQGMWSSIVAPDNVSLPASDKSEATCDLVMFENQVLGSCCQCSVVWTEGVKISVTSVLLRFHPNRQNAPLAEWSNLQYPIRNLHTSCEPMGSAGSYVVRYSPDGQVLAVGVNQRSASLTTLLYISPLTETVVVADPKHCGTDPFTNSMGMDYWLADLAWTSDSLFLVILTRQGSMAVASRLGDPLAIQSTGCELEMGPTYYLPLHPLMSFSYKTTTGQPSLNPETDAMRQRFSLAINPRLPMILCSDGYRVSVLHLPPQLTSMTLARGLLLESSKHLASILQHSDLNLSLVDAYKLPANQKQDKKKRYKFEKPSVNLDSSIISVSSVDGTTDLLGDGKITFGNSNPLLLTAEGSTEKGNILKYFEKSQKALFTAWGLLASNNDHWSQDMESVTRHTLKNLIKLFSILLDSPAIEAILDDIVPSSSTGNRRVFKLVGLYRAVFYLLQFDSLQKNLLSSVVKFCNGTVDLLLSSDGVKVHDSRLKTFSGCLAILSFTEMTIDKVYALLPKTFDVSAHKPGDYSDASQKWPKNTSQSPRLLEPGNRMNEPPASPSKRLEISWKLFFKHAVKYHRALNESGRSESEEGRQLMNIMSAVQRKLQPLDVKLSPRQQQPPTILSGDKLSLNGMYTQALTAWKEQLQQFSGSESRKVSKLCHAQLYTYLLRGDLKQAIGLVDGLLVQSNVVSDVDLQTAEKVKGYNPSLMTLVTSTMKNQGKDAVERVPCIKNKAVRKLVQSLARFMVAYFTNQTLHVFPLHNPQPLPPIHTEQPVTNTRLIPVYHGNITESIRRLALASIWTTERTVEYLMLSGLVCEGVWFADHMGDWKTAYLLSVACQQHSNIAPHIYNRSKRSVTLPQKLQPQNILEKALQGISGPRSKPDNSVIPQQEEPLIDNRTDLIQLTSTIESIVKAGIMSNVDTAPWLLQRLLDRLRNTVSQLPPLVPGDFYLPAPPMYCPQPTYTSQDIPASRDGVTEMNARCTASSLTHLILCVLEASNLSLPLLRWYVKDLAVIQQRAAQFKATTEGPCDDLPDLLKQHQEMISPILPKITESSVQISMAVFRDFLSIQWSLHVRDKLSILLRQREKFLSNLNHQDYMKSTWSGEEEWLKTCFTCLQWAVNLLPFRHFLPDEGSLYKVVLSLLIELPPSEDTADILAENLHDYDTLDSEVQEKLTVLLKQWQSVILTPEDDGKSAREEEELNESKDGKKSVTFLKASPRGKTLSLYFEKQCQTVHRLLKKKAKCFGRYDEYVFADNGKKLYDSYEKPILSLKHDLFIGSRPFESKQSFMEFLDYFSSVCFSKLVEIEAESNQSSLPLLEPFGKELRKKEMQSLAHKIVHGMAKKKSLSVFSNHRVLSSDNSTSDVNPVTLPSHSKGLFRSKSLVEPTSSQKEGGLPRSVSDGGLEAIPEQNESNLSTPRKSPRGIRMTEMASKFWQSEEVLYKESETSDAVSLDVDFGKKYSALQSLLEWLTRWADKHHSLILDGKDCLQPKVRIQIPAQLVVLALWLIEHKYNDRSQPLVETPAVDINPAESLSSLHTDRGQDTEERKATEIHRSKKQKSRIKKSKTSSNTNGEEKSAMNERVDDRLAVRDAYVEILDGHNDRDSVEDLSSNESDFLSSLSIVRSGGSPMMSQELMTESLGDKEYYHLNSSTNTVIRKRSHRKKLDDTQNFSVQEQFSAQSRSNSAEHISRKLSGYSSRNSHTSPRRGASPHSRESSRSPDRRGDKSSVVHPHHHKRSSQRSRKDKENIDTEHDLATQLQRVVRSELRRMMEVQHKSMMVMMGAMDETVLPASPRQRSPRQRSPEGSSRNSPISSLHWSQGTMGTDELDLPRSKRKGHRGQDIRGVMKELQGLQKSSIWKKETEYERNAIDEREDIPKFLRVDAERDTSGVRFPQIFSQNNVPINQPLQVVTNHVQMPLLKLTSETPGAYGQRVSHLEGFGRLPPPGYFEVMSHQQELNLLPPFQTDHQRFSNLPGMPLLRLHPDPAAQLHQFNSNALDERDEQKEAVKGKLVQEFQKQQRENWEKHNLDKFGKQFLRVDFNSLDKPKPFLDRDNDKRQRRRAEKKSEQHRETSEDIDEDNVSSETVTSPVRVKQPIKKSPQKPANDKLDKEDAPLHDGYAIPTGIFESYLKYEDEFGEKEMTNAKYQYEAAKTLEQQEKQRKMVDFSAMTKEEVETEIMTDLADRGVQITRARALATRETGTDPVQEALIAYNRGIQGNILPPDIYLGLRFGEENRTQPQVSEPSQGFLNVVDIRASSLLRDLEKRDEVTVQSDLTVKHTSHITTADFKEELRESYRSTGRASSDRVRSPERTARDRVRSPERTAWSPERVAGDSVRSPKRIVRDSARSPERAPWDSLRSAETAARGRLRSPEGVRGDALTVGLFKRSHMDDDSVTAAVFSGVQSRERSRESVIRQLRNMDATLRAVDQMSSTMEQDFANTRLLLSTIESVGEIIHPDHVSSSPRSSQGKVSPANKHTTSKDETPRSSLTPIQSEKSPQRSVRSQPLSPGASQRQTKESGGRTDTKVSGLSGISDIIGEMLAEGGIDLTEAGLTPDEARQLTRQATLHRNSQGSAFDSIKMSMDKLQQIMTEAGPNANKRGTDERKALQEWMATKRHKQQAEYKKQRKMLQETERDPFKPSHEIKRDRELLEAEKRREEERKTLVKENAERRYAQATRLLGDILTDEVVLPEEPAPKKSPATSPKSARFSGRTQTRVITPRTTSTGARPKTAPSRPVQGSQTWQQRSSRGTASRGLHMSEYHTHNRDPQTILHQHDLHLDERPIHPMPRPFLLEQEETAVVSPARERTDELSKYTRVVDSLDKISEGRTERSDSHQDHYDSEPDSESTVEPYQPKPYTQIVRLQRPEVTRKQPPKVPISGYTDMPSDHRDSTPRESPRQDTYATQANKEKLYGSKHIPGTSRVKSPSPRRVKTYAERLQDMKRSKKVYGTPIVPKQSPPKPAPSRIPRKTFHGPLHKPMTYTQQLQKLSNTSVHTSRGPSRQVYVRPKVGIRSRGPPHKPQTYTQQLQILNQQAPKTFRKANPVQPKTFVVSPQKSEVRSRPYADPYTEDLPDDYDVNSDLSSWEVDERVKQILYNTDDGELSSYGTPGLSSRDYQASEGISDYYDVIMSNEMRKSTEYSESVDVGRIRDIADAASVSSGSIMSFIDWDAVDQLIGTS